VDHPAVIPRSCRSRQVDCAGPLRDTPEDRRRRDASAAAAAGRVAVQRGRRLKSGTNARFNGVPIPAEFTDQLVTELIAKGANVIALTGSYARGNATSPESAT
jgi:hypothetical protein